MFGITPQEKTSSSARNTSHPSATKVDIDVIHMIGLTRPLPSIFVHCKQPTVGRPWNEASWLVCIAVLSNYQCDTGCCVHVVFAKRSKVYLDNST